jgi:SAM-dependent methyltransferase
VDKELIERNRNVSPTRYLGQDADAAGNWTAATEMQGSASVTITGESCDCPTPTAPTRPAVILDPFAGTGTVPAVANALGRYGVGIDLSADYLRLARWRCQDPGLRAKVLRVDKPAAEVPGQMALL